MREAAEALVKKLTEVEETLYQTKAQSPQDPLNFPIRSTTSWRTSSALPASATSGRPTR